MAERFLSRWARLKGERETARGERELSESASAAVAPVDPPAASPAPATASPDGETDGKPTVAGTPAAVAGQDATGVGAEPEPRELPPIDSLTPDSDFTPFLRRDVAPATRNAALKKLFADPAFNVMDGLDVYIEDFNQTTPIPEGLLRRLAQSKAVGLFDDLVDEQEAEGALRAGLPVEGAAPPAPAPFDSSTPTAPTASSASSAAPPVSGQSAARAGGEGKGADGSARGDAVPGNGGDASRGNPVPE